MSTCWDCSESSLGNVSQSAGGESGMFEWGWGWCSKSLLPGCSALAHSMKHELGYFGPCGSYVGDEVVPGLGD